MVLTNLHLPKESVYKQFIPKKQFYEHGNFTTNEKDIFTHDVKRITLHGQLTRDNTNIDIYKDGVRTYEEIAIFFVELRKQDRVERLAKLVMSAIPYPIIFIGEYEQQYIFYGAHQRDNKQDEQKNILEKVYQTGFIDDDEVFMNKIDYQQLSKNNLYEFYNDYIQAIITFNLKIRNIKDVVDSVATLQAIEKLEEEISLLQGKMKRENHFNKKMDINIQIKQLENKLKQMEE